MANTKRAQQGMSDAEAVEKIRLIASDIGLTDDEKFRMVLVVLAETDTDVAETDAGRGRRTRRVHRRRTAPEIRT